EERYSRAVKNMEFDRQLGPYTLMEYRNWRQLSSFLTKDIIEKFEPIGGEITVACESRLVDDFPKSAMERALHEQSMTSKFRRSDVKSVQKGCYFTPIPRIVKHKGISGQELTSLNLDKTHLLERLLAAECGGNEDRLLGELQFAFVAFLMGQSLEAFLQWKSLVSLLLGCSEAPFRTRTQLFTKFIKAIYYQLRYGFQKEHKGNSGMESTPLLDDSWFSDDSFLYRLCKDFFSLVDDTPVVDGDLLTWTRKLKELLENTLGWSFQNRNYADGLPYEEDDESAAKAS
ncbi:AAR2-like protein, partial [Drosera capensis]